MAFTPPSPTDIVSGGFTPPSPEDVVDSTAPAAQSLKQFRLTPQQTQSETLYQPSQFSSGIPLYGSSVPIGQNPDAAFTTATRGGLPGALSSAAGAVSEKVIEPAAAALLNTLGSGGDSGNPVESDDETFKAGQPIVPDPLAGKKGFLPAVTRTLTGLTTPGSLLTLPLAAESKPIQAAFLAQTAAQLPDSVQNLEEAKTSDDLKDAATSLGINVAFAGLLSKGLKDGTLKNPITEEPKIEGEQDANQVEKTVEIPGSQSSVTPEKVAEGVPAPVQQPSVTPKEQVVPADNTAAVKQPEQDIPPLPKGDKLVTVQRPDGTTYQAAFGGKYWEFPGRGQVESIAKPVNGQWSHGMLAPGEKILPDAPEPEPEIESITPLDPQSGSPVEPLKPIRGVISEAPKETATPEQVSGGNESRKAPSGEPIQPQPPEPVNPSVASPRVAGIASRVSNPKEIPVRTAKPASDLAQSAAERGFEELPDEDKAKYSPVTKSETLKKVSGIVDNLDNARSIIRGEKPVPKGVPEQPLWNAMEKIALDSNNSEMINELISSPIASRRSIHAQELGASGFNQNAHSPVEAVREITQARAADFYKRTKQVPEEAIKKVKNVERNRLDNELKKNASRPTDWASFINSIACRN